MNQFPKEVELPSDGTNCQPKFVGFSTANGSEIIPSTSALAKMNQFLKEFELPSDGTNFQPKFVGFSTASGSKITPSTSALAKMDQFLKEFELPSDGTNFQPKFVGFSTASGSEITPSTSALAKMNQFLKEFELPSNDDHFQTNCDFNAPFNELPSNCEFTKKTRGLAFQKPKFAGFSTINGSEITPSTSTLAKTKQFLKEFEDIPNNISCGFTNKANGSAFRKPRFVEISPANNVSEILPAETSLAEKSTFRQVTYFETIKNGVIDKFLNEIDIVGFVIDVALGTNCDTIYLVDGDYQFVSVKVWEGLRTLYWNDVASVGNFVALANLSIRTATAKARVPQLHTTECSVCSAKPKSEHLSNALDNLRQTIESKNLSVFRNEAKHRLNSILAYGRTPDTSYEASLLRSSSKCSSITPGSSIKRSKLDKFNNIIGDEGDKPDPTYEYLTPKRMVTKKDYKRPRRIT